MPIDHDTHRQITHLIRPISNRTANMIARATVRLVDDGAKLRDLQVECLPGEVVPDGEHFEPFGFTSVPLEGADGVALFPTGDRSHPLVIVVSDRRYRPTGKDPGTVTVYNHTGASLTITKDGDIVARPAAGRSMLVDDGSGAAALPTMADFAGIVSIMNSAGTGAATALPAAVAAYQAAHPTWPAGTQVFKGK